MTKQMDSLWTALREYGQHKSGCWLTFETRNLVPSEQGLGMRFRQDGDGEPTCTCGLAALLDAAPPSREQQD